MANYLAAVANFALLAGVARSQPSTADGHDPTNCGPQVLIAAISVTVIRKMD
jgi:hypothetical protein